MRAILVLAAIGMGLGHAADRVQTLRDVKAIYVDSLGNAEGAELIRDKIINRLAKSQRITVTLDIAEADAILTGTGEVSRGYSGSARVDTNGAGTAEAGTTYDATLAVRLISKDKQILWTDDAKPRKFFTRSVSSSVADKVVKNLLKAFDKTDKERTK